LRWTRVSPDCAPWLAPDASRIMLGVPYMVKLLDFHQHDRD
jgi:hypothetical protein